MPELMVIPSAWMAEAGVQDFKPAQRAYRCDDLHECVALADIEVPLRNSGYPLDANGFGRDRMVRILMGIRDNVSLPAICVEAADQGTRRYRVRCGVHRYHATASSVFQSASELSCQSRHVVTTRSERRHLMRESRRSRSTSNCATLRSPLARTSAVERPRFELYYKARHFSDCCR